MPAWRGGRLAHRAAVQVQELFRLQTGATLPDVRAHRHYIVGTEQSASDLQTTALLGLWSLVPYAVYLVVYLVAVYYLSTRLSLAPTLVLATVAWTVGAIVLLEDWSKAYPI